MDIFRESFMLTALSAGLVTGLACAYLGVFIILKRIVFMGIALAEIAALGVALGLFIGINPFACASVLTLIGVIIFWTVHTEQSTSRESFIGFVYVFCTSLAVLLIAKNPMAEARGINLISGNLLYTTWQDVVVLCVAVLMVMSIHLAFFKKFLFISFDKETAFTAGISTNAFDLLLYVTIGIIIGLATKTCGVIFVFASLLIPAMIGLIFAGRVRSIFIAACLSSSFCVITGLVLSYVLDLPTSPTIVVLYGILYIGVFIVTHIRIRR